jgi:predicted house-cleaning noncanonical NTP pyrophosphatase (MazG superfamily)
MKTYNKLVRNKIPIIINNDKGNGACKFHVADQKEFEEKLYEKLGEELSEFVVKPSAEEIADMLEVIEAIAKLHNIGIEEIKKIKIEKKKSRGGFNERIILESTD